MATGTTQVRSPESELVGLASQRLDPPSAQGRSDAAVPTRILLVPWGWVDSSNGRFLVDEEGARLAIEAFEAHGTDLPIDYEHQSLGGRYTSPTGQAPAAGWIKRLEAVPGQGLFATVEWTQPATEQLAAKQYRFLSPVAIVRRADRKLVGLHSAALTNKPAIVGMQPIVNRREDAPAVAQATGGTDAMRQAADKLSKQLGLEPGWAMEQLLLAASERIEELGDRIARREAEDRVAMAMKAGKLTEHQRPWAVELAMRDPAAFEAWEQTAPVVVPPGLTEPPEGPGDGARAAIIAKARAEYRQHPALQLLTSEQAFVEDALRESGYAPTA